MIYQENVVEKKPKTTFEEGHKIGGVQSCPKIVKDNCYLNSGGNQNVPQLLWEQGVWQMFTSLSHPITTLLLKSENTATCIYHVILYISRVSRLFDKMYKQTAFNFMSCMNIPIYNLCMI